MTTILSSGEEPVETTDDGWTELLPVPGTTIVDHMVITNEGDFPGFWRLVSNDGGETPPARLPAGGGESGERRSSITVNCPGFSGGALQVKRGLMGGHLTKLFAFAGRNS